MEGVASKSSTNSAESQIRTGDEAIKAARSLVPVLRERAEDAENSRVIPEATIADIAARNLFKICAPRHFGGAQLPLSIFVDTVSEIASGCGSTGWVYAVLAGHYWTLSLLPLEAQKEVFADSDALIASLIHLKSEPPEKVDGGYLIEEAEGRYCSGVDHAAWLLVGSTGPSEDGGREPRYFLLPREDFTIVDDWYAAGLRGTGSKSMKAKKTIFVPEHRSCSLIDVGKGTAPGMVFHDSPLYRLPFRQCQRLQLLGVLIGIARAALNLYAEECRKRLTSPGPADIPGSSSPFLRLADAHAAFDAAAGLVFADLRYLDGVDSAKDVSAMELARQLHNIAYAGQECRRIVTALFEATGARGLLDGQPLQRLWRDANAAAAHTAFAREAVDLPYGRAVAGVTE